MSLIKKRFVSIYTPNPDLPLKGEGDACVDIYVPRWGCLQKRLSRLLFDSLFAFGVALSAAFGCFLACTVGLEITFAFG